MLFPTIYFLRRDADADKSEHLANQPISVQPGYWAGIANTVRQSAADTIQLFRRLLAQSAFYRVLAFFLLIGFLKAIFLQMDYVFPKFGDRVLGLHAPVGKLANINAILIILLVPTIGALTQRLAAYRMVVIGGAICAAGVFIMALPTEWFVPAAQSGFGQWLGHDYLGVLLGKGAEVKPVGEMAINMAVAMECFQMPVSADVQGDRQEGLQPGAGRHRRYRRRERRQDVA